MIYHSRLIFSRREAIDEAGLEEAEMSVMDDGHTVPLPGTEWRAWRDVLVRSAGFPADGLDRFAAPGLARTADAFLAGEIGEDELEAAYTEVMADTSRAVEALAVDPLFREAVTWQNPAMVTVLEKLTREESGAPGKKKRERRRFREDTVARYWQRYCGKNDTIGFFGPVTWGAFDPEAPAVVARAGHGLTRSREVFYEFWALEEYVARLCADPVVRPWLKVGLHPHLRLDGERVLRPEGPPLELSAAEAAAVARCDGLRSAAEVAGTDTGVLGLLEGLVERDVIWWGVDMPYNPSAEGVLRATLAAIPDPAARERAHAGLARLDTARDAVAAAAGDPDKLAEALALLDEEFTAVTGVAAERRPGEMYAGRTLCYEETVRDLDLTFGGPLIEALSGPFGRVLLPAARWVSAYIAETYATAFRALYEELRAPGAAEIPLSEFWEPAHELINGADRPAEAVMTEFTRRWHELFDVGGIAPGTRRVNVSSEDLAGRVAELFAAERPGWASARIHSPDLHVCAPSVEALAAGDFTLVLGEMHAGWPTMDCAVFADRHPDPAHLRAAAAEDIGPQFRPLYPTWWPRYTARVAPVLGVTDLQIAFTKAPGADPDRVLPITELTVFERDGALAVTTTDGRMWPLSDVFSLLVGWHAAEAFKLSGVEAHTPRLTVDRLVVTRETWRMTAAETGLLKTKGRLNEYLAARRLRRELDLPEQVFVKLGTEVKPVYVDFTSPRYISAFATMLRTAHTKAGDDAQVVIGELLPGPEDAWLPDAEGRGYCSELRIQLLDPRRPTGPADAL